MARALLVVLLLTAPSATWAAACEDLQATTSEAALGDTQAQYNLGVEFFRGECVPKDLSKAAVLWRKAANSGHLSAHNNLGWLTFYGNGVPQDEAEGIRLWKYAAERGHAESQAHLAWVHLRGRGVERDPVVAYAWAKASLESSRLQPQVGGGPEVDTMSRDTLKEIETALTSSQRIQAEKVAQEFISRLLQHTELPNKRLQLTGLRPPESDTVW